VKANFPNLSGKVMSISEMRRLFRKIDALGQLKKVVETFPYLWTAAYDGLEQSSMMEDDSYALWFHSELTRMDPGFQDLDYSPGELERERPREKNKSGRRHVPFVLPVSIEGNLQTITLLRRKARCE
jgi:hypothetical protein